MDEDLRGEDPAEVSFIQRYLDLADKLLEKHSVAPHRNRRDDVA